jgi:hypothetical protein
VTDENARALKVWSTLLLLALATPAGAFDQEGFRRDIAWVTGAHVADMVSTEFMLSACEGCYEANPFMEEGMVWKKAVGTAVTIGLLYVARKHGGDRVVTWVRWGIVAFLGAVTTWNLYLGVR